MEKNKKLIIYKGGGSNGTKNLEILAQKNISQDLNGDEYVIELERNRKITTLKLKNSISNQTDMISFDGSNVLFKNGAGNHRPHYFIYADFSGVCVSEMNIYGYTGMLLAHIGDSLSESNGRADEGNTVGINWIEQVMAEIDWDGSIVAQSGMQSNSVLNAINNEIKFMKPKYLSVMIGTNGGSTEDVLNQFIEFCNSNNIIPIINKIPVTEGREPTDVRSSVYVNNLVQGLWNKYSIKGAAMDVATSSGGNPANGYDPSCFVSDKIHTNQKGNNQMFEQFMQDVPYFK